MRNLPSGSFLPFASRWWKTKHCCRFSSNARVIRAAGGAGASSDWLLRHINLPVATRRLSSQRNRYSPIWYASRRSASSDWSRGRRNGNQST
ncbi:hypothetical protein ACVXHB_18390 [Escherichia coli]